MSIAHDHHSMAHIKQLPSVITLRLHRNRFQYSGDTLQLPGKSLTVVFGVHVEVSGGS